MGIVFWHEQVLSAGVGAGADAGAAAGTGTAVSASAAIGTVSAGAPTVPLLLLPLIGITHKRQER